MINQLNDATPSLETGADVVSKLQAMNQDFTLPYELAMTAYERPYTGD